MLVEVEIHDFALLRAARLELGAGLNVLTGETGAGKSLVVDAVGALLGERVGADLVRAGADAARLRAVFDLTDCDAARAQLADMGLEPDDDGLCVIQREIRADGRTRCRVNGTTVTVGMLRALGERLIDLHGQHEHQSLLRTPEHLGLLDAAGGPPVAAAVDAYRAAWRAWREALAAAAGLRLDEGEKARRADTLRDAIDEIAEARPQPREEDELLAERSRLAHAGRLLENAATAHRAVAESDEGASGLDRLATAAGAVRDMARWDAELAGLADELAGAVTTVQEAARTLSDYADSLEADPRRLDALEERLERIARLKRKYGGSIEAVLAFGAAAEAELDGIESADQRLAELAARAEVLRAEAGALADRLGAARRAAAAELEAGITAHLRELGLPNVVFAVSFARRLDPDGVPADDGTWQAGPDGVDAVEFLFSANPGEPPRPLSRIASGGEISRVMLAVKSQLAASHAVPTMIFDEIDTGIGGVTIHAVGRKMAAIARRRQVIGITHHAAIAARADGHLTVTKSGDEAVTVEVERVADEARVRELARMLGRVPPTEATLAMARELLAEVAPERSS